MSEHKELTVYIAEPSFFGCEGHFARTNFSLKEELRKRGNSCVIWSNRNLDTSLFTEDDLSSIRPVYSAGSWGEYKQSNGHWRQIPWLITSIKNLARFVINVIPRVILNTVRDCLLFVFSAPLRYVGPMKNTLLAGYFWSFHIFTFFTDSLYRETLKQIKKEKLCRNSIILTTNITPRKFLKWILISRTCISKKIHIRLLFRYPVTIFQDKLGFRLAVKMYYSFTKSPYIQFFAETKHQIDTYQKWLRIPIKWAPIAHLDLNQEDASDIIKCVVDKRIHVGSLGNPRFEKGFDKMVEMLYLAETAEVFSNFVFHIQVSMPERGLTKWIAKLHQLRQFDIRLYEKPLCNSEYENLCKQLDILLLPYVPAVYTDRTSGPLCEAIANAKIAIVTENTWLQEELDVYGSGLSVPWGDAQKLLNALCHVAENFEEFTKKAETRVAAYRARNNAGNFLDRVLTRREI